VGHRQLRRDRRRQLRGNVAPRVVGWHAEFQVVRVLQGRRDAQSQLLHVRVVHVRLKVELVQALGGQKARLVGADNEVLYHVVEEEANSGAFTRHMRVAVAQLSVQFANALFLKRQKY
jgi:hypothetical protein